MSVINEQIILSCLEKIIEPISGRNVVELGIISGLVVKEGNIGFALEINPAEVNEMEIVRKQCEEAVYALNGVSSVSVVMTAEQAPAAPAQKSPPPPQQQPSQKPEVPGVAAIVAIASGKGGVGKSTCAVNIALGLQAHGLKVGMLDADVYGPSLPRMLGISGKPDSKDGKKLIPMENGA